MQIDANYFIDPEAGRRIQARRPERLRGRLRAAGRAAILLFDPSGLRYAQHAVTEHV